MVVPSVKSLAPPQAPSHWPTDHRKTTKRLCLMSRLKGCPGRRCAPSRSPWRTGHWGSASRVTAMEPHLSITRWGKCSIRCGNGGHTAECKIRNLKWSAIFPILHEFDWPCVQSECTMLKFWLAILKKWSEIGQWPAVILHSGVHSQGVCCFSWMYCTELVPSVSVCSRVLLRTCALYPHKKTICA